MPVPAWIWLSFKMLQTCKRNLGWNCLHFRTCALQRLIGRTHFVSLVLKNSTSNFSGLRKGLLNAWKTKLCQFPFLKSKANTTGLCSNSAVTYTIDKRSKVIFWQYFETLLFLFPLRVCHRLGTEIQTTPNLALGYLNKIKFYTTKL